LSTAQGASLHCIPAVVAAAVAAAADDGRSSTFVARSLAPWGSCCGRWRWYRQAHRHWRRPAPRVDAATGSCCWKTIVNHSERKGEDASETVRRKTTLGDSPACLPCRRSPCDYAAAGDRRHSSIGSPLLLCLTAAPCSSPRSARVSVIYAGGHGQRQECNTLTSLS
jgi:hypothetical protein